MARTPLDDTLPVATIAPERGVRQIVAPPSAGTRTSEPGQEHRNHALAMAAEGSDLIMLGEMGMAAKVDTASVEHGKAMLADARKLWSEVMKGKAMQGMMGAEASKGMTQTHDLAEAGKKVIDLLEKMHAH